MSWRGVLTSRFRVGLRAHVDALSQIRGTSSGSAGRWRRATPYVYRVSKYDPTDRDVHGHYTGAEGTISDHGEVEAACLQAVQAFAADSGIGLAHARAEQDLTRHTLADRLGPRALQRTVDDAVSGETSGPT